MKIFIEEKRAYIQAQYEEKYGIQDAEVKFDIVAHSMGGVLTRYFLRYGDAPLSETQSLPPPSWAGADDVERAILVAPPNAGSLEAFEQLVEGFNTGRPVLPHYAAAIIGSFPSVYQLLPRSRHNAVIWDEDISKPIDNLLDPKLWQDNKWGLSGDDEETTRVLAQLLPNISDPAERHAIASEFQARALRSAKYFQEALDSPLRRPSVWSCLSSSAIQ